MAVALRKESVDRNFSAMQIVIVVVESLSARRAWIEIVLLVNGGGLLRSLSARRAWIEILFRGYYTWIDGCRSPQGERG